MLTWFASGGHDVETEGDWSGGETAPVIGQFVEVLFYVVMVGLFVTATLLFFGLTLLVPHQVRV